MKACLLSPLLFAAAVASAQAPQYRWIDEKGRVHYTDTPPPASARNAQKKDLRGAGIGVQPNFDLMQAVKSSPVTLYSAPQCVELCQSAREILNKRGVPFTEISVSDATKLEELRRATGGQNVPVLLVGNQVEKTPTAGAYNAALDVAGYPASGILKPRRQAAPPPPPPTSPPPAAATPAAPPAEPADEAR
jgi:glutaredoxin